MPRELVLASASPRRLDLLRQAGIQVLTAPAGVPEHALPDEAPAAHVERLARAKAAAIAPLYPRHMVLGSDTIVYLPGKILGKPKDLQEAREMITALQGRQHQVYTGVCLLRHEPRAERLWHAVTTVSFKALSDSDITNYLQVARPLDKAGAYAIQEHGDLLGARIQGLLSTVVGLPIEEVKKALILLGWQQG